MYKRYNARVEELTAGTTIYVPDEVLQEDVEYLVIDHPKKRNGIWEIKVKNKFTGYDDTILVNPQYPRDIFVSQLNNQWRPM